MKHESSKTNDGSISTARKKRVLGRGLDALFPDIGSMDTKARDYFQCDIDVIRPNPFQPRRKFAEEELAALSSSIKEQGILQPLLVRRNSNGYELIAGERRLRASKMAGLSQVPVVVKEISDTELLEASIVENIQREDLNPMEEAEAYQRLMDEFKMTQQKVAERVGKSRSAVANFLRLCQLPQPIKASLMESVLSMGHARALLGIENATLQTKIWQTVISNGLSVRQTEALVKKMRSKPRKKAPKPDDSHFRTVAEDLARRFGTKVNIKKNGAKGKVEIEFYSNDDLDRLLELLQT